jgi:CRP/FNR family transcriptional regulator, cyclic AMP receptor protein
LRSLGRFVPVRDRKRTLILRGRFQLHRRRQECRSQECLRRERLVVSEEAGMARQRSTDERLARVPLFDGLSKKQLSQISSLMTRVDLVTGDVLARQGEIGREFVILLEGEAEVARDGKVIAVRGPGDYIGEIALLDNRPRTATVTAKTAVAAEILNRAEFSSLLADAPDLSSKLMATLARRLAELESEPSP